MTHPTRFFDQENIELLTSYWSCLLYVVIAGASCFLALRKHVPHKRLWWSLLQMCLFRALIPLAVITNKFDPMPHVLLGVKLVANVSLSEFAVIAILTFPPLSSLLLYRSQARIDRMQNMETTYDLASTLADMNYRKAYARHESINDAA